MSQAKVVETDNRISDARRLSCESPLLAVREAPPAEAPDRRFLQFLAEWGALPIDLVAALMRCSEEEVLELVEQGIELGWIRYTEYAGERRPWASLRDGGRRQLGKAFGRRKLPTAGQLSHRRAVVEAHLLLREEKPKWSWIGEAAFRECNNSGLTIPDGVIKRRGKCWAVEVERSRKLTSTLREKLERLCAEYDGAIYFASLHVRTKLARLQSSGDLLALEVRPLPSESLNRRAMQPSMRDDYEPSRNARRLLVDLNEEGIIAVAQLSRLPGWGTADLASALAELTEHRCVRRGLEHNEDGGWLWCNHRGSARSGTGLPPVVVPSRGELVRRIVLMEVRFDVLARWPDAVWITRRLLNQGHAGRRAGVPRAVVERGGKRYAVMVLETRPEKGKTLALLERWKTEYTGVLCYRSGKLADWTAQLCEKHELDWVEVRGLPQPPASAPYQSLEDEWRTGREPYTPTGEEVDLLRVVNTEGLISELQLPRVLGCSDTDADRIVSSLVGHNCLRREDGWIRCTDRGAGMSDTGMDPAPMPMPAYLEQRFQLMEVRLQHGEPVSPETWKTRRQLGGEKSAENGRYAVNRQPDAAVLIDGEWDAVALFFRGFRRKKLAKLLSQWSTEYRGLRCYCREANVEDFRRFVSRYELSAVEVLSFPAAPEGPARARQETFAAALRLEKEEQEKRYRPKLLAQRAVADAVRRGELKKPARCEECNEPVDRAELHGHHPDYSRPLDVEWLCTRCHPPKDKARREQGELVVRKRQQGGTMKVNVNMARGNRGVVVPVELTRDDRHPEGWAVTLLESGEDIGRVYKDSYTYSPAVRRRSRIARDHWQVSSWSGVPAQPRSGIRCYRHFRTRREVLVKLIRRHRGGS